MLIPSNLTARAESAAHLAISTWGQEKQLRMAQEEMGECIAAINRLARGRAEGWEQATEEVADVAICLVQLRMMLGEEVDRKLEEKLARLESRLAEAMATK